MLRISAGIVVALSFAGFHAAPRPTAPPAPPFKCIHELVAQHMDSMLVRWTRGDIAGAVQEVAPDAAGGFSAFTFGPVTAAHQSELGKRLAGWRPEAGLKVTDMKSISYDGSNEVVTVGALQVGNVAKPGMYQGRTSFNCRTGKILSLTATSR